MAKQNTTRTATALFFVGAIVAAGCDPPGKPNIADRPIAPHEVQEFEPLFRRHCVGCHGADGTLGPAPPLNDPIFLAIVPDEELQRIVREGRHGTSMPGFAPAAGGALTDEQTRIVAGGIKPQWLGDAKQASADYPPYAGGSGNATRGAAVFAKACANCHGASGEGTTIAGALNDIAFLSLISDQALRRIIITGRPDLKMPNYAERDGRGADFQPLTSAEIDDVVALLAQWRSATAGEAIVTSTKHSPR